MTIKKKTLYEILEVAPHASISEIQAAHQRLSQKLQSENTGQNREDISLQLKVVNLAARTLSDRSSRDAYDAKLASHSTPTNLIVPVNAAPIPQHVNAASLKAEALSLKADAVLLKADAVSLKVDAMSLQLAALVGDSRKSSASRFFTVFAGMASPFRRLVTIFAGLVAIGMVIQVAFVLLASRQMEATSAPSKAEEQVIIQEYYQTHGVRPGSKVEAELLEVENRRSENDQRAAALEAQRQEEEYRRFVEESRRRGAEVSADLRRAEETARYEAEQERQRLEQERLAKEEAEREAERNHIESERRKLGLN